MKKIITCAGYHGTGSSLVTDLLKEFTNIKSFGEYEFRFLQDPNGVGDLEERILNNNSRLNSDRAIYDFRRFIKKISKRNLKFWKQNMYKKVFNNNFEKITVEYLNSLIELKWKGSWMDSLIRDRDGLEFYKYKLKRLISIFYKIIEKIFRISTEKSVIREEFVYSFPTEEEFLSKTRKYLDNLWKATNKKEEILSFDQLVPVCNMNKYIRYFDDIKIIVVDRDPRDLYVLNKYFWKDGVVPVDNVDIFIKHFRLTRKHQQFENEDENKVLKIKFEDAIYNYDLTLSEIINFLGINEKHVNKFKYFNPKKSINNTQIYRNNFVNKKDIEKIEKELSEYCYKFPYELKKQNISKIY